MGSPASPTTAQIAELEKAGQLKMLQNPDKVNAKNGTAIVNIALPRQGVTLLKLDW